MAGERVAMSIESGNDLSAPLCPNFGRAPRFLLASTDGQGAEMVVENTAAAAPQGAGPGAVALLAGHGVSAVISGRFGPKAYDALVASGIEMYTSVTDHNAGAALERFRSGGLKRFEIRRL